MSRDDVVERVTRSRQAQGLPPKVVDPATLARIAFLILNLRKGVNATDSSSSPEK